MTPTPDPTLAAPATIYLQDGGDYADAHEVTWCQHSVDDADTAYIRLDLHTAAVQAAVAKAVEAERAEMEALVDAAHGLSFGEDWNKGNAALHHGYRQKLLAAIGAIKGKMASPQAIAAAIRALVAK